MSAENDHRPYFFALDAKNHTWMFIAMDTQYETNMIPIEKWEIGATTLTLNRIAYTKDQANDLLKNCHKIFTKNDAGNITFHGPDLYCVLDMNTFETVATIWKQKIATLEIQYNGLYEVMNQYSTYEQIKGRLMNHFESKLGGKINVTAMNNNLCHILSL